jgi:DNA (cytosine-5)-methyltransferase 1
MDATDHGVDMVHLSTPCQLFSSMHVVPGVNDEVNSACLFCTENMLEYFNPIIHTQEQASGLFSRHPQYFLRLISDIFESGYNIRWKLCRFRDWGMSVRRRRLIIIAARSVA